tara:strand:- start:94 stop:1182 length:1089 start_codon:yes stop_codon:yes gene_type:complete
MGKKGISAVVASILIVLLTVASVAIIWVIIRPTIEKTGQGIEFGSREFNMGLKILGDKIELDRDIKSVAFVVKRKAGKADLTGLKVILLDSEGNIAFFDAPSLDELESEKIEISYLDTELIDLEKISVAPIFTDGDLGNIASEVKINPGKNYPYKNLVGYWKFDDNFLDSSGNGNHGVEVGTVPFTDNGQIGKAVQFSNDDSNAVKVSDNELFHIPDKLTVTAWIKRNSVDSPDIILENNDFKTGGFRFDIRDDNYLKFLKTVDDGAYTTESTFTISGDSTWHFVAFVYSKPYITFYLDNEYQIETMTNTEDIAYTLPVVDLHIGRQEYSADPFDGDIDEVRLYNRALSSDEIFALYEQENP